MSKQPKNWKDSLKEISEGGWFGVDLDGTLAEYTGYKGPKVIGAPITKTVKRVQYLLGRGITVKVFTARADDPEAVSAITEWCKKHIGQPLEVTNVKDPMMVELWDDRARRIGQNTGEFVMSGVNKRLVPALARAATRIVEASLSGDEGCYISVLPDRGAVWWLTKLRDMLPRDLHRHAHVDADFHSTVLYTKDNIDHHAVHNVGGLDPSIVYKAEPREVVYWNGHKNQGVIVLTLKCAELERLHYFLRNQFGVSATFDEYVPHITLCSDFGEIDKKELSKILKDMNRYIQDAKPLNLCGIRAEDVS
jgi:hypothetical protein